MLFPAEQAAKYLDMVNEWLRADENDSTKFLRLWNCLAYVQSSSLAILISNTIGNGVYSGPFKGMKLASSSMTGAYAPYLLGIYESELHDVMEAASLHPYQNILNIGCSFGYYSIGFALRNPLATIHAFEICNDKQKRCRENAELNSVQNRIRIAGLFQGKDFDPFAGTDTLVIMDIEGGEIELLNPDQYPALRGMDIIVELHDVLNSKTSKLICERFAASHEIQIIPNCQKCFDFTPLVGPDTYIDPFDSFLVGWESRTGPTPWAVMKAKDKNIS